MRSVSLLALLTGLGVAIYLSLCLLLYCKQDDFLFVRLANDSRAARAWEPRRIVIRAQNTEIEGWWADRANAGNEIVILYFGGNAEDVLYSAMAAEQLHAKRFLVTNYRGYGNTPGNPSEAGIFSDALAIYDYAITQPGVTAQNIVVVGRSLGSGVATYVAAKRQVRGVVLITPYDSILAVAKNHFPYFPVAWLLKHRFPSAKFAEHIQAPALMISADHDDVIPAIHTQRLFDAWAGPKRLVVVPGAGHDDINSKKQYYDSINEFLDEGVSRRDGHRE